MKRKVILFLSFLVPVFLFISCSIPFDRGTSSRANEEIAKKNSDDIMDMGPVKGGSIKLYSTRPDTLNPLLTKNFYVRDLLGLVFEGLVKLDGKLNTVPQLAESWEVSEDGLNWTFYIRENVTWHDNVPFSAEDVEFTCEMILRQNINSSYTKYLENISAFAAIDKYIFRVVLKRPYSFTAELMTFPVIPKHCFVGEDILRTPYNLKPVGTGPYRFVSYNQGKDINLAANDKWWGAKNTDPSLPDYPYISEVQAKIFNESQDLVGDFYAGNIDAVCINTIESTRYKGRKDLIMRKYPGRNYEFLAFNLSKPALGDAAVRQAVAYAVDKLKLINDVLQGQAIASDIPAFPGTWINESAVDYYTPNKDKSREILAQNGWKQSSYGMYKYINGAYNVLNLEMLVNEGNEGRIKVAEYIAKELSAVGINLQIKKVDWNTGMNLINTRRYDMALMGCYAPIIPDLSFLYSSVSNKPNGDYAYNVSGYNNPVVDGCLQQILTENDSNKRKMLFSSMKNVIMDEVPYLGLFFHNESMLYSRRIRGEIIPDVLDRYNGIARWYLQ